MAYNASRMTEALRRYYKINPQQYTQTLFNQSPQEIISNPQATENGTKEFTDTGNQFSAIKGTFSPINSSNSPTKIADLLKYIPKEKFTTDKLSSKDGRQAVYSLITKLKGLFPKEV